MIKLNEYLEIKELSEQKVKKKVIAEKKMGIDRKTVDKSLDPLNGQEIYI